MPELLLPPGRRFLPRRKRLGVNRHLDKTRPRRGRTPEPGMLRREVPGARAAHGEPGHIGTVHVDRIVRFHGGDGFKDIDLATELLGVAEPAIWNESERVARRKLRGTGLALSHEGEFAPLLTAAKSPHHHA